MRITADCARQTDVSMVACYIRHKRWYIYCKLPPIAPGGKIRNFFLIRAIFLEKKTIPHQINIGSEQVCEHKFRQIILLFANCLLTNAP